MAKLQAGILSNVRGAVAGVVGGTWKGKNYIRARVTPANPNTVAQQAQRTKMSRCVAFSKLILGSVLQVYVDPFQKYMSGFNWFVKANIDKFTETPSLTLVKLTEGTLFGLASFSKSASGNDVMVSWDSDAYGPNGAGNDSVYAIAYRKSTGQMYFAAGPESRASAMISVPTGAVAVASDFVVYAWVSKLDGGKLLMVSNSQAL